MLLRSIPDIMPDAIAQRLADLPTSSRLSLCELWKEHLKSGPPLHLRRHLMIQVLAYRLQEQAFGSVSEASLLRLRQLARVFETNSRSAVPVSPSLKPGTRLVRQWRDQVHLVNVEASGYEYQGVRYMSLSEIARLITGTRWSGPLFFGVKSEQRRNQPKETQ
jgi:hypothetical protein